MKLSIIIPVYNVERYIARCLDSVFDQDIPEEEYEVICVNDCSTDSSANIIRGYESIRSNLTLINLQENRGSGYARSVALNRASGEYVWFVDADDTVFTNVFNRLFEYCSKQNLDILLFNYQINIDNSIEIRDSNKFSNSGVMSGVEFVDMEFNGSLAKLSVVWHSIYSKNFLTKNQINFPDMRVSQDAIFAWRAIIKAERMESISEYFYCFRPNIYSTTESTNRDFNKYYSKSILFAIESAKILDDYSPYGNIRASLIDSVNWGLESFIKYTKSQNIDMQRTIHKKLRANYNNIIVLKQLMNKRQRLVYQSIKLPFCIWGKIVDII